MSVGSAALLPSVDLVLLGLLLVLSGLLLGFIVLFLGHLLGVQLGLLLVLFVYLQLLLLLVILILLQLGLLPLLLRLRGVEGVIVVVVVGPRDVGTVPGVLGDGNGCRGCDSDPASRPVVQHIGIRRGGR